MASEDHPPTAYIDIGSLCWAPGMQWATASHHRPEPATIPSSAGMFEGHIGSKSEKNLTTEEGALLELLVDLVHDFKQKQYPLPSLPPHRMVSYLLERQG